MVVQHNLQAMNASRMLGVTTGNQSKSTEKLSSGYRINRAADDAAGLSISEKMRKQIRGLTRASTNAQDGVSCVQTAEGALTEVHSMLQRMNELAVQSANGTNSDKTDRKAIQDEIDQLCKEIDRVSETTKFNETYLLKGDGTTTVEKDVPGQDAVDLAVTYKSAPTSEPALKAAGFSGTYYLKGETTALTAQTALDCVEVKSDGTLGLKEGVELYTAAATPGTNYGAQTTAATTATFLGLFEVSTTALRTAANAGAAATAANLTDADLKDHFNNDGTIKDPLWKNDGGTWKQVGADFIDQFVNITPAKAAVAASKEEVTVTKALTLNLHVGADSDTKNKISIDIESMSTEGIGIKGLKVNTEDAATAAIDTIAAAIQKVSDQRSSLGAVQNRLEHTIANLDNVVENTTSAESRIRDTDMASQMVEYSKNNILAQAGQSMLAQANQSTQGVLSLLQ